MEYIKPIVDFIAVASNLFSMAASGLAVYLYFTNRGKISAAFQLLLNFSFQTTLTEIKEKLERLNEYNANEAEEIQEIRNILHEIAGQIRGNSRLLIAVPALANKIEALAKSKKLTEPAKRSIVSEVRENIRNIQVNSIEWNSGNNQ